MDNKKPDNQPSFNDPISWKSLGFFSAEEYLVYVFKKTEKITAAIYLVSGLLKDNEPIKWELRDKGIDLLSSSFSASSSVPGDRNAMIQSLFTAALETLSLLNVARISNLISEMNHKLLVHEIDNIVAMLRDRLAQNAENAGYVLSEDFFRTPDLFSTGFRANSKINRVNIGADAISSVRTGAEDGRVSNVLKKTERQALILNLLKDHSGLTISDFTKVIKDCSAKTIQRELVELVEKGVVKKEGERRWCKYSLS